MQVFTAQSLKEKPNNFCVTALGNFDGVHPGHAHLITQAKEYAKKNGYDLCVYTFSEHPSAIKGKTCSLLTTGEEKKELLEALGCDILFLDSFEDVKDFSCEDFCKNVLVGKLNTRVAFCGKNFRFGKDRSGNFSTLEAEMKKLGSDARVIDHVEYKKDTAINSTAIRKLISEGDTEGAEKLLSRPYSFTAKVIHGRHLATHLGAPTINQTFPEGKVVPKNGVYAVCLHVDGKKYIGVANVGTKPTVTDDEKDPPIVCETHIINYKGDLYGKEIKTEFYKKLRDEKKFSSLEELSNAIKANVREAISYFEEREENIIE